MLCVPDLMAAYQAGAIDADGVQAVQPAMIAHCELMGDRMAILDPPPDLNAAAGARVAGEHGRLRLEVRGALLPVDQGVRPGRRAERSCCRRAGTWPASGRATTRPAACTRRRRTRSCAASSALGRLDHPRRARPAQPGRASTASAPFPGRGIRVWGARTLSSDPSWRYLNVRRLYNYVESSLLNGTQWVVFEPERQGPVGAADPHDPLVPVPRLARRRRCSARPSTRRSTSSATTRPTPARPSRPASSSARSALAVGQARRVRRLPPRSVADRHERDQRVRRR